MTQELVTSQGTDSCAVLLLADDVEGTHVEDDHATLLTVKQAHHLQARTTRQYLHGRWSENQPARDAVVGHEDVGGQHVYADVDVLVILDQTPDVDGRLLANLLQLLVRRHLDPATSRTR